MPDPLPSPAKRKPVALAIVLSLGAVMFVLGPFALFCHEFITACRQYRINHTYQPVKATALGAEVKVVTGSKGAVHYVPVVRYQYSVAGTNYWSDNLAALSLRGTEAWADGVTNRYPVGQPRQAYYNPQDPGQAILRRSYSFEPYFNMLEMAFCLSVGSFLMLQIWFSEKLKLPLAADGGWFEVRPELGERQRLLRVRVCSGVWYGFGAISALHCFLFIPPPYPRRWLYCFLIYALLGLIPLGRMIYYTLMNRNMDEARLRLDQEAAFLGRRTKFALSQRVRRQLLLKSLRVRLLCIGTRAQGRSRIRRTLYETTAIEWKDHTVHEREDLELPGEFTLPPDQRPTGPDVAREFDRIDWQLRLECEVPHAPDYKVSFPINVLPAPAGEPAVASGEKSRAVVDVRPIDPQFAGRFLTKRRLAVVYFLGLLPLMIMMLGIGSVIVGYPTVFPKDTDFPRWLDASESLGRLLFFGGCLLAFVGTVWGLAAPSLISNRYNYRLAAKIVSRRRDAIVTPGPETWLVDVVPRSHWNRMMLENAADIGFLAVDDRRREIRFEGDKERYRIPADAIRSCELEKSFLSATARANAPGTWLVILRAAGPDGAWEAPFGPRVRTGRTFSKTQQSAARELQARIKTLLPATPATVRESSD